MIGEEMSELDSGSTEHVTHSDADYLAAVRNLHVCARLYGRDCYLVEDLTIKREPGDHIVLEVCRYPKEP